ncbi:MAG TPA: amino acid ABC transporter permease [Xylella taiwanensis]
MLAGWENFMGDLQEQSPLVLDGIKKTLVLALTVSLTGFLWGVAIFFLSISHHPVIKRLTKIYMDFFIGTPLIIILFVIYYGLPQTGIHLSPFIVALTGFTLNVGAYNAAYMTTAFNAIAPSQAETATVQGFTRWQVFRLILLPQVFLASVPALTNQVVSNIKDSTVAFLIQYPEFFARIQEVAAANFEFFRAYLFAAIVYLILITMIIISVRAVKHCFISR